MLRFALTIVALAGIAVFVGAHMPQGPRRPTAAEISDLAEDAYVVVGEVPLSLPFIAIRDQTSMGQTFSLNRRAAREEWRAARNAFRAAASDPTTAPDLETLDLYLAVYGWGNDSYMDDWKTICPQLRNAWARSICDDPWAPLLQALPENRITLMDDRTLERFKGWTTVGGENGADHIRAMTLVRGVPDVVCDHERTSDGTRSCTAAILVENHLMMIWGVGDSLSETAEEKAAREGRALAAFVRLGLGRQEKYPELEAIACASRQPGSGPGLVRDEYVCGGM